MPRNWRKVVDDSTQLQYENSESGSFIVANKQRDGDWTVIARDTLGRNKLGSFSSKQRAKSRMQSYMKSNTGGSDLGLGGGSGGGSDVSGPVFSADDESDALDDLNPF